jgi:hypothetical protein
MGKDNEHKPEVYKRLEQVRKEFQRNAARQRKQKEAQKRKQLLTDLLNAIKRNKTQIIRLATFSILAILVLAVILVLVFN